MKNAYEAWEPELKPAEEGSHRSQQNAGVGRNSENTDAEPRGDLGRRRD